MEEFIIRVLQGGATEAEERRAQEWRRASRANEARSQEVARLWDLTGAAMPQPVSSPPPSAEDLLGRGSRAAQGRRRSASVRSAVAAGLVLVGFAAGWFMFGAHEDRRPLPQFITGPTETATATLADGSVIRLAPNTRLRVNNDPDAREAWLDGRAYFAVASDERNAFVVRTAHGDATVLGTRFEVTTDAGGVDVLVVEGLVEVSTTAESVNVGAGQRARAVAAGPLRVAQARDIHGSLAWLGDFIAFQSTPLWVVAEELQQRHGLEVEISDPAISDRTVTAWFSDETAEGVLQVVCRIASVRCSVSDSIARIGQ